MALFGEDFNMAKKENQEQDLAGSERKIRPERFEVQQYEIDAWENPNIVTEVQADDSPFEEVEIRDADGKLIDFGDHAENESPTTIPKKAHPMPLQFTKPEHISLKGHPDLSEKWLQDRIIEDPTILGLGEVEVVKAEKIQPKAGRLDLLLYEERFDRRYEVELMLGKTDASHIMRCIEYWDIERRRYPAYDHIAVLVAEDVTSRFLNLMSLLAGSIPLIAIQVVALKVGDTIALHFVRVLDQRDLRSDDTFDSVSGPVTSGRATTDRGGWIKRASTESLEQCDRVLEIVKGTTGETYSLEYGNRVRVASASGSTLPIWMFPQKRQTRVAGYIADAEAWVKRFDEVGLNPSLVKGNKAVSVPFKPDDLEKHTELLREFLREAIGENESDANQI